jgi:hypothetical protein
VWRGSTTSPWRQVYGRILSVTLPVSRPEPQRPANDNDEDKTDPSVDHYGGGGSGERYAATNESDNQRALDQPDPARKQRSGADHGVRSVRDHDRPRSHVGNPHGVTGHDEAGHVCDPIDSSEADTGEPVAAARSYHHDLGHEGIDAVESVR